MLSSWFRAAIFFFVNLTVGWSAAVAAMGTELVFRGITSGFYGAISEGFAEAEPQWAAALCVMVAVPVMNHSLEFGVHWLRGTQKLMPSIAASVVFTVLSTLFNLYAMRRGALTVGSGARIVAGGFAAESEAALGFFVVRAEMVDGSGGTWCESFGEHLKIFLEDLADKL